MGLKHHRNQEEEWVVLHSNDAGQLQSLHGKDSKTKVALLLITTTKIT